MPLTRLFPASRILAMREQLLGFARGFGITDMEQRPHIANTRRMIALAEFARDRGKLDEVRALGMDAYWRHGKDLEDDATLREIAVTAGLDPDEAIAATRDPAYLDRIDARRREAQEIGITGIPTFVIGNRGVVGCQPYEVLEQFVVEVGGAKRR